jgi:hypothetical protein
MNLRRVLTSRRLLADPSTPNETSERLYAWHRLPNPTFAGGKRGFISEPIFLVITSHHWLRSKPEMELRKKQDIHQLIPNCLRQVRIREIPQGMVFPYSRQTEKTAESSYQRRTGIWLQGVLPSVTTVGFELRSDCRFCGEAAGYRIHQLHHQCQRRLVIRGRIMSWIFSEMDTMKI